MATIRAALIWLCLALAAQDTICASRRGTTCACGSAKKGGRIVGGTKSTFQYPWIIAIAGRYKNEWINFCGASIINEKVAISAAHCFIGYTPKDRLVAIAGLLSIKKGGSQIAPITKWVIHPKYDGQKSINDVSIFFLAKPLVFNQQVQPVCMPTGRISLEDKWVRMIGWGAVGGGEDDPDAETLMEVDLKVISNAQCKKWHPNLASPQTQICTLTSGKGGCHGDSGGPVVYLDPETNRYTLVGLVSMGDPDCKTSVPTVCSEVAAFLPWIISTAKIGLVSMGDPDCKTSVPTVCSEVAAFLPWIISTAKSPGCHKI